MVQDHVPPPAREGKAGKGPSPHSLPLVNLLLSQTPPSPFDHNFSLLLLCSCIFQQPSSKQPVWMKRFPSPNLVERMEKRCWPAAVTVILCPGCSPAEAGAGPSLRAAVIQPLRKLLYALAHAPNCTTRLREVPRMDFRGAYTAQLGSALPIFNSIPPECPPVPVTGPWPRLHGSSHDDCLRRMEAGEGSWETERKTEGKAFSFIYFSKICNRQMHLLFPEVIILSLFLHDPALTLGGGSNLFQILLLYTCLSL